MSVKRLLFALLFSTLISLHLFSAERQGQVAKAGGLELDLACDKENYIWMEPITLSIVLRNTSDKPISIMYDRQNPFRNYEITVLDPARAKKVIPKDDFIKEDHIIPEHKPSPLPKTEYYKYLLQTSTENFKETIIQPRQKVIANIQLNALFDLSYPSGSYTIIVQSKIRQNNQVSFELEKTLSFTIKKSYDYESYPENIASQNLCAIFGKTRAYQILSKEAEALLTKMEKSTNGQIEKSKDYRRLMMLLRSLSRISKPHCIDLINHMEYVNSMGPKNKMTPADLHDFIKENNQEMKKMSINWIEQFITRCHLQNWIDLSILKYGRFN